VALQLIIGKVLELLSEREKMKKKKKTSVCRAATKVDFSAVSRESCWTLVAKDSACNLCCASYSPGTEMIKSLRQKKKK